jgi:hypothetical protein
MALNHSQKEFVGYCVGDYLDEFVEQPHSPQEFIKQLTTLKTALDENSPDSIDDFMLYNLLRKPTAYFFKLEERKQNKDEKPITIADVRQYIVEYITPAFEKKARQLNIDFSNLWNYDMMARQLSNSARKFVSQKSRTDSGTNDYSFEDNERIFSGSVYAESPWVYASVVTELPDETLTESFTIADLFDEDHQLIVFRTDEEEDVFLRKQLPIGKEKAELQAATNALHYLTSMGALQRSDYIDPDDDNENLKEDHENLILSQGTITIITYRYYFSLLKNKILSLKFFENLTTEQIRSLLEPLIIALLKANILKPKAAANLNPAQVRLFTSTYYHDAALKETLDAHELLHLSTPQCSVVVHPTVINLLKLNKLTFTQAKQIPTHLLLILTHPVYFSLIAKNPGYVRWDTAYSVTPDTCRVLLKPEAIQFIVANNLSFDQAVNSLRFILEQKYGAKLTDQLFAETTSFTELNQLTLSVISHVDSHPFLSQWLDNKMVTIKYMLNKDIQKIEIETFAARLFSLHKNRAIKINKEIDTLDNIQNELTILAEYHKLSLEHLREGVVRSFIMLLKNDLAPQKYGIYADCHGQIVAAEKKEKEGANLHNHFWQDVLALLIQKANTTSSNLTPPKAPTKVGEKVARLAGIFGTLKKSSSIDSPNHFCNSLNNLALLCEKTGRNGLTCSN